MPRLVSLPLEEIVRFLILNNVLLKIRIPRYKEDQLECVYEMAFSVVVDIY